MCRHWSSRASMLSELIAVSLSDGVVYLSLMGRFGGLDVHESADGDDLTQVVNATSTMQYNSLRVRALKSWPVVNLEIANVDFRLKLLGHSTPIDVPEGTRILGHIGAMTGQLGASSRMRIVIE